MEMKVSERGNYYVRSRNLVLVFKQKYMGYVVVAISPEDDRMVGYVYISLSDLKKLVDYVERKFGLNKRKPRHP